MYDNELYHYGIPGMRWGHRKSVYDVNANYYNKRADKLSKAANRNRTMASMNEAASKQRQAYKQSDAYKAKRKKALKVGAAQLRNMGISVAEIGRTNIKRINV